MNDKHLTMATVGIYTMARLMDAMHWIGQHLSDLAFCATILAGLGSFAVSMHKLFSKRRKK